MASLILHWGTIRGDFQAFQRASALLHELKDVSLQDTFAGMGILEQR